MTWPFVSLGASLNCMTNFWRFSPRGPRIMPTGGAGAAAPPSICSLTISLTALAMVRWLEFLHLQKVQFDGRLATEDGDEHLHASLFPVDLVHLAVEVLERAVGDFHALTDLHIHLVLRFLHAHAAQQVVHLESRERRRHGASTDESGDVRGVADHVPRIVVHDHFHEHVAGVDLLFHDLALAAFDADLLLLRHEHLEDLVLESEGFDALLQVARDVVLIPAVGMDGVPLARTS